ncbi:MAG: hypothetical protein J7647_28185 [Cyanobacteria bacterium SBLK]|nr:hypothetical protein [Cyanobacteria bacterium SBLK]
MREQNQNISETLLTVAEESNELERDRDFGNIVLETYLAALNQELDEIEALWQSQSQRYKSFRFTTRY